MPEPVAIVGDVHGSKSHLEEAITWLADWAGHIVFVGDYVNRGPNSKQVLELLVAAKAAWGDRLTLLLGNHDAMLLGFLRGENPSSFLRHGGLQTVRSYLGIPTSSDPLSEFREFFPASHRALLESMPIAYETVDLLVTHAGFDPEAMHGRRLEDVVFGRHSGLFAPDLQTPRDLVVCGHYVQRTRRPFVSENFICLDTGCGTHPDAPLTLLTVPLRRVHTFYGAI